MQSLDYNPSLILPKVVSQLLPFLNSYENPICYGFSVVLTSTLLCTEHIISSKPSCCYSSSATPLLIRNRWNLIFSNSSYLPHPISPGRNTSPKILHSPKQNPFLSLFRLFLKSNLFSNPPFSWSIQKRIKNPFISSFIPFLF